MEGGIIRKFDVERPAGWVPANYEDPEREISELVEAPQNKHSESDFEGLQCVD